MKNTKKISLILLFFLAVLTICFVSYKITLAAITDAPITISPPTGLGNSAFSQDIPTVISLIFNIIISASGAVFIITFLIGGIQYLSSSGNEEGTGKAKKILIDAVIGLILVLSSWAIGTWVIHSLGSTGSGGSGGTIVSTPQPMPGLQSIGPMPSTTQNGLPSVSTTVTTTVNYQYQYCFDHTGESQSSDWQARCCQTGDFVGTALCPNTHSPNQ